MCVDKVGDHADTHRTDGLLTTSVAVLPSVERGQLAGRGLRPDAVHLAQAGTQEFAKQGTAANIAIPLCVRPLFLRNGAAFRYLGDT